MYVAVNVAAGHAVARVDVPEHIAALHAVARVYVPRDGRVRAADDGELALDIERRAVIPKIHVHALARPARKRRMTYELMPDEEHGVQHRFLVAPREIVVDNDRLRRGGRGGHYIHSITYGMFGTVFPHVDQYLNEGIDAYNADLHMPDMHLPPIPHRGSASAPAPAVSTVAEETQPLTLLERIAKALERGQQKKLLQLCQQALDEGHDPQEILSAGLVQGMTELGEAFSANRVFVPEMLIAARCMTAATALLKPYMTGEASEIVGRACIGTVQGDMHDIGKNLVKIMLEGSNIQVYDLGADVPPEEFIHAAREHHCDIIACSALLTTTMQQMRQVVELTKERGIRDKVKIMVGGAPISQSFCDEIGADVYTEDAASAARVAVSLLRAQTCTP